MNTYEDISILDAVKIFCRMVGCDEDDVVGFTAEPGRIVLCRFVVDPNSPPDKLINDDGIPMVGDYTADFGSGTRLTFVEGSLRPITDLITVEGDDQAGED